MTAPSRKYAGATTEQRDRARRERLIDAGLELFGTVGYASTTVDAICAAAGVSTRNFYDHFKGREALLVGVYDHIVVEAQAVVAAALAEGAPHVDLATTARRGLAAFAGFMLADPRRARVNFIEVVGASLTVERHRREVLGRFAALLTEVAHTLMAAGTLIDREPATLRIYIAILIGGVQEALTDWLYTDVAERPDVDALIDALVEVLVSASTPPAT